MSRFFKFKCLWVAPVLGLALHSHSALACAACFGGGSGVDGPLASGLNWGIFTLLAVVVCVLGGIASFAIFLARRAAAIAAASTTTAKEDFAAGELTPSTQKA